MTNLVLSPAYVFVPFTDFYHSNLSHCCLIKILIYLILLTQLVCCHPTECQWLSHIGVVFLSHLLVKNQTFSSSSYGDPFVFQGGCKNPELWSEPQKEEKRREPPPQPLQPQSFDFMNNPNYIGWCIYINCDSVGHVACECVGVCVRVSV